MIWTLAYCALAFGAAAPQSSASAAPTTTELTVRRWEPLELAFDGPFASESDVSPNPFLDYRLQVTFTAPSGETIDVPGFFDGDAEGGGVGTTWKVRVSPDEVGEWSYVASFRQGTDVAIDLDPFAGTPTSFNGTSGVFQVGAENPSAKGFLAHGRLEYVGAHNLRFQDGTWFLKTGTNSPENLFGYAGFDGVADQGGAPSGVIHNYGPHVADWNFGDPSEGSLGSPNGLKGIIGALNYLSESGVNSIYLLPMNLGGDGQDTAPFLGYQKTTYDKTHYDTSRLAQWNTVLQHTTRLGIQAQLVLSETEPENKAWLDNGVLGPERKLFFRELVARFGHNLAIKWNLGEESNFSILTLTECAEYLRAIDPYDHPVCVHTHVDDFYDYWQILGNPLFDTTSIQYSNPMGGKWAADWRANSQAADHPWVVDLDENGTALEGVTDVNAVQMRKEVLYDVLFSGGGIEWYLGGHALPLGGDVSLEDFRTRDEIWRYSRIAREVLENNFEFWNMEPRDELVVGEDPAFGGAEVFARSDRDYAIYLPKATAGAMIDLSMTPGSVYWLRWYDPRTGLPAGEPTKITGGGLRSLGTAPWSPTEDWIVVVKRAVLYSDVDTLAYSTLGAQTLTIDAGPDYAGDEYAILGTLSGTGPGMTLLGVSVALNPDLWTVFTLKNPNTVMTPGFAGVLSAGGRGLAKLDFSTGMPVSLIGATMHHAVVGGKLGVPAWSSAPVKLVITP